MNKVEKIILSLKLKFIKLFFNGLNTISIKVNRSSIRFNFRSYSDGDIGVIKQIFKNKDYDISQWVQGRKLIEYHRLNSNKGPSLIIDAGANIGASALYFSKQYINSHVFAIEPEKNNYQLLKKNTKGLKVFNFNGAIANRDGTLSLQNPGRSDWGFMTSEKVLRNSIRVKSISPSSILSHPFTQDTNPLIFKIDIEGGELSLFKNNLNWIDKFPLIIIELHDWMLPFAGTSKNFIKAIAKYDFDLIYSGENIFLFNRKILNK